MQGKRPKKINRKFILITMIIFFTILATLSLLIIGGTKYLIEQNKMTAPIVATDGDLLNFIRNEKPNAVRVSIKSREEIFDFSHCGPTVTVIDFFDCSGKSTENWLYKGIYYTDTGVYGAPVSLTVNNKGTILEANYGF